MRRIYISCTNRVERPEDSPQDRGEAYVIDWDDRRAIARLDLFGPENIEVGRSRGGTGIAWHDDKIYIACRSGISVFNPDTLECISKIRDVRSDIHQIVSRDGKLYIACTGTDSFTVVENDEVIERVNITETDLTKDVLHNSSRKDLSCGANKLHFNSIAWDTQGDMYHLYAGGGMLYNWSKKKMLCATGESLLHDLLLLDDNTFLTNECSGKTILVNLTTKNYQTIRNVGSRENSPGSSFRLGFLRGTALDKKSNTLFLASSPGKLTAVSISSWKDEGSVTFSTQPQECPYDIVLDPRDWT